jgi:hypothetical protein
VEIKVINFSKGLRRVEDHEDCPTGLWSGNLCGKTTMQPATRTFKPRYMWNNGQKKYTAEIRYISPLFFSLMHCGLFL